MEVDLKRQTHTYTDTLLVGGELREDVVGVGRADPHLREVCEFLRHLVQQRPHLRSGSNGSFPSVFFFFF